MKDGENKSDVAVLGETGPRDGVFREPQTISDFAFGEKVAAGFDDMLDRSVPFYQEIQRMVAEMAADFALDGTNIYDLGCSTGNTFLCLHFTVPKGVRFIGLDYSEEMLKRCRQKLSEHCCGREHELICADLDTGKNSFCVHRLAQRTEQTCQAVGLGQK
jgi:tRNA (cmo5U34)-methyltransferase